MPHFIKTGYWEKAAKGFFGWLNLDLLIQDLASTIVGPPGPQGVQGPQGIQGVPGPQGIQGETGAALTVLGSYPNLAAFLAGAGGSPGNPGEAWLIESDGSLYIWNTATNAWEDVGDLQGPPGPQGIQGVQGEQGPQGVQGIQGDPGSAGGFGKYGSFYDTTNQTGGSIRPFTLNSTDFSDGVSIVSGSEITFTTLGKYNIAFSAQVIKTGGTSTNIWIWLRHNGVDVPNSATVLEMGNNNTYLVAAWNFFINVNSSPQQFQLMWYTPSANISIGAISDVNTPVGVPGVPSIILTVNQVG
jgi:hypothetical protein